MGLSVAGEMDRAKLEESKGRLRRQCITSGVEKWERTLLFNLEKESWSFSTEAKARVTAQTLGVRMLRFLWTLQLDGRRVTPTLGNERGALASLGWGWPLITTVWGKRCCLAELGLTE